MTGRQTNALCVPPDPSLPGPARLLVPDRTPRTIAFALLGAAAIGLPVALFASDGPGWGIATFVILGGIWGLLAAFGTIQSLVAGPGWIAEKRAYRWHIVRASGVRRARIKLSASMSGGGWLQLYSDTDRVAVATRLLAQPAVAAAVQEVLAAAAARGGAEGLHADGADGLTVQGPSKNQRRIWRLLTGLVTAALVLEALVGVLRLFYH